MSKLQKTLSDDDTIVMLRQSPNMLFWKQCCNVEKAFQGKGGKTGGPLSPNMERHEITRCPSAP